MAKNRYALRNEDLEKVTGGKKHTKHRETRFFLNQLFHRDADSLGCENPRHKQKQG